MKRVLMIFASGLLLHAAIFAQMGTITQQGKATHELEAEGLYAAHNRFSLDATITVINTETDEEIEVTILDRIPISPNRVIDLSEDAWAALGLTEDTVVKLIYNPPSPGGTFVLNEPEPAAAPSPGSPQKLYHLLVLDRIQSSLYADIENVPGMSVLYKFLHGKDGYLVAVYTSPQEGPVFPVLPDDSRVLVNMSATRKPVLREYVSSRVFRRFVTNRTVLAEILKALEDASVKVIPRLPNPGSGKVYRLQVGAFTDKDIADEAFDRVIEAGLEAGMEEFGRYYRILAEDVPAARVAAAVQKLGEAGFSEIWIRE